MAGGETSLLVNGTCKVMISASFAIVSKDTNPPSPSCSARGGSLRRHTHPHGLAIALHDTPYMAYANDTDSLPC